MIDTGTGNQLRQAALWGTLFSALGMAALAGVTPRPLEAQAARGQAAAAQPQFTRIFGSDSIEITRPALSPDGRWIVFDAPGESRSYHLWVVPASGGAPIQLTSGPHTDAMATWFPSGDRIAFVSNMAAPPGEERTYVTTIPFDARTGRSAGPAQQVSLEVAYNPVVSPDGRWIAFRATRGRLMVVPSAGGTARTVVRVDGFAAPAGWSPDLREIYFVAGLRGGSTGLQLMRVSADSGQAQPLWSTPGGMNVSTTARQVYTMPARDFLLGTPVMNVQTFEGRHVASLRLHRGMSPGSISADGRSILATRSEAVAPIRVVPVAGGPSRTLTEAREYDELDTWTADASRLAVRTRMNGHGTLLDVPLDGGQAAEIATPPEASRTMVSPSRGHLFYLVTDSATDRNSLRVRRLSDGRTREIARDLVLTRFTYSYGGWPFSGEEILYTERRGDRIELRGCAPEGQPRLLRAFPLGLFRETDSFGVHGARVAWVDVLGDSSALLVAEGPHGAPQRVATVQGSLSEPVWSPDGRWIAAGYSAPGAGSRYAVLVVGVTTGGQPSAPPRIVPGGPQRGWSIKWLPDSRAVTVYGVEQGLAPSIWLVSLREGDAPVNLTRDDSSKMWSYSLSPDGRYIAYPAEIPRGSSIWRIDLRP